jgi:hypothetical protein
MADTDTRQPLHAPPPPSPSEIERDRERRRRMADSRPADERGAEWVDFYL